MSHALPPDLAVAVRAARVRLNGFDRIEYFAEVDSTNDLALTRAAQGCAHGTVIIAETQHAGRGRLGRAWHSPPESGIYMSVVLRSETWTHTLSLVTMACGIAVVQGLRAATGLVTELKWPNDVVIGRPWRKLAGILSETASAASYVDGVVVGIGVNVRGTAFPPDLGDRATAVEVELGRPVDRMACIVEILAALSGVTSRLQPADRSWVAAEWKRIGGAGLGSPVRWHDGQRARRGITVDIDDSGALIVDTGGGRIERIISGEVTWERLSRE
jgi:BirA family biotin operon repressor/biotin-[acetyl-CoA-carboxylase] ligase